MQRQCIYAALSTEAVYCELGHHPEDDKLNLRQFVLVAERLAVTLGACGLLHVMM